MAFSSVSDARTKLINPETNEDSIVLYANNNLLDNTTIFYTNAGLTSLAPSGNYVIPEPQFRSYYVSLGNDGKIVTSSKEALILSGADTSWVDDYVVDYDNGIFIPNDNFDAYWVGTSLSINGSNLVTDAYWSTRSYAHAKKWIIDQGTFNTTALTNIDVSAMKGYDLRLMTGEWYQNNIGGSVSDGFVGGNFISAIIHVAEDLARTTQEGRVYYYFRPDYIIPLYSGEYPSYFKRFPNVLPINDRNGNQKDFMSLAIPLFDMVEKGSGVWNTSKRIYRNSTRNGKGYTYKRQTRFVDTLYGDPPNSNYYMYREVGGGSSSTIYEYQNYSEKHVFDVDTWIKSAGEYTYNLHTGNNFNDPATDAQKSWCVGLFESLLITDPTARASWTFNNGIINKTYAQLNPRSWETTINSGTGNYDRSPANGLLGFFSPFGDSRSPQAINHGKHLQFDFELVSGQGKDRQTFGQSFTALWNSCKTYSIANSWSASGGVIPTFSNYEGGIYTRSYEGSGTNGWRYVSPGVSVATAKTTDLYKDYKEYYFDGSKNRNASDLYWHKFYEGAIDCYSHFFVTAYLHNVSEKWYLYNLVHSADISRKLITEILGSEQAKTKKVCGYSWRYMEPTGGSDFYFERKGFLTDGASRLLKTYRPNNPPSHNQSIAAWSFAYLDGLYLWDDNVIGGEYNKWRAEFTTEWQAYGDIYEIDNGAYDWFHIGYWQILQNRDIVAANTDWVKPEYKNGSVWTSNTDANTTNFPIMLYNAQLPISAYKLSADGTEALLLITNPFNNGYTMDTHTVRLPTKANQEFIVKTWGNYTTVVRLKNL